MSGFSNPLVGGGGGLVYPSIHSPGFKTSPLTGWSIDKDGNAFFASITLPSGATVHVYSQPTAPTGSIATGSLWFDTSTGNLISRWDGSAWIAVTWNAADVIGAGTISASLLVAGIVVAGIVDATTISAATFTGSVFEGTDFALRTEGGFFYSGTPSPANFLTGQTATFDGGLGTWTAAGNCTIADVTSPVHSGSGAMAMTASSPGNMAAAHCLAANILTQGLACSPGDQIRGYAWLRAFTVARSVQVGATFYTSAGVLIGNVFDTAASDTTTGYTQVLGTVTAPATAAFCRLAVQVLSAGGAGEIHDVDDPFLANLTATPGNLSLSIANAGGVDIYGNPFSAGFSAGDESAPQAILRSFGGLGQLYLPTNPPTAGTVQDSFVEAALTGAGTSSQAAQLVISGPANLGSGTGLEDLAYLQWQSSDGTNPAFLAIAYQDSTAGKAAHFYGEITYNGLSIIGSAKAVDPSTGTSPTNPGAAESWHNMSLTSGWSAGSDPAGNVVAPAYKLLPDGNVAFKGSVIVPASGSITGVTFATLPAAYRPASNPLVVNVQTCPGALHQGFMIVRTSGACQLFGDFSVSGANISIAGVAPMTT